MFQSSCGASETSFVGRSAQDSSDVLLVDIRTPRYKHFSSQQCADHSGPLQLDMMLCENPTDEWGPERRRHLGIAEGLVMAV